MAKIACFRSKLNLLGVVFLLALATGLQSGPLHDAVNSGDMDDLEKALEGEVSIDDTDWMVGSPLHVAVGTGNIPAARLLLAASRLFTASQLPTTIAFFNCFVIE